MSDFEFPPASIPTAFADGILNLAHSKHVAKFYLARLDPAIVPDKGNKAQPFAQIVMPIDGVVQAFAFLELAIRDWVETGVITEEQLEVSRSEQKAARAATANSRAATANK